MDGSWVLVGYKTARPHPPASPCLCVPPTPCHNTSCRWRKTKKLNFKHRRYEYEYLPGSVLTSDAGSTSLLHIPASSINIDYKKVNKEILKSGSSLVVLNIVIFCLQDMLVCPIYLVFI